MGGSHTHGAPPVEELAATPPARGNQNMDKEQSGRIDKRILWTQDEDLRVVSNLVTSLFKAWLISQPTAGDNAWPDGGGSRWFNQ